MSSKKYTCAECDQVAVRKDGKDKRGKQRYKCSACGSFKHPIEIRKPEQEKTESFIGQEDRAEISKTVNQEVRTLEDLIRVCNIDINEWEIERWMCNKWESFYKIGDGSAGHTNVPLYQVKAWLKKNRPLINLRETKEAILDELKKFAPKYPKLKRAKVAGEYLLEIDIPDLHFGKLAWAEESGQDYDIKIAQDAATKTIESLINQSKAYKVDRILFPIGNDYFNVNSKLNTTAHNTPQQEDTRWQKTFKAGRLLAIKMIDMLQTVAPVDVLVVPGNHDEERAFYLGDSLESWYHKCENVNVDNRAQKRKYYRYGKNLIGLTHGYYEKLADLPMIMAHEQKANWAECKFLEWQTGDKHHKKEIKTTLRENEEKGVMIRVLRSLSANDAWHFDKGLINQVRAGEAFIRHKDAGVIAQFLSAI